MNPIVTTQSGKVEGDLHRRGLVFRGIPYARAPREGLRLRRPEPVVPWAGVKAAQSFGPAAPQSPPVMLLLRRLIGAGESSQSQDCLYLNVWTPAADSRRRPVMVFLHGGAFVMGSGSTGLYSGSRFAHMGDVVVVTLNYRLGALGYLNLREIFTDSTDANLGLRDQIAALGWVRDNIDAFGGDPENVTVFGESAGAMSVGTLLGVPSARPLFHRAILQSGASHNVATQKQATRVAETFLRELDARNLGELEKAPVSAVLAAQRETTQKLGLALGGMPWQPSIDGDLLPARPLDAIEKGAARDIPVLVGTNRDEWKLFALGDRRGRNLDETGLQRRLARALPGEDSAGRPLAERALEAYRGAAGGRGRSSPRELWEAFQSDRIFHHPAHRLAELQCAHNSSTFAYLFSWSFPGPGRRVGACHGIELPFVFGTLRDPLLRPLFAIGAGARRLSDLMQLAWVAFARSGDPTHPGLPDWPGYEIERRPTMILSKRSHTADAPFAPALRFWSELDTLRR